MRFYGKPRFGLKSCFVLIAVLGVLFAYIGAQIRKGNWERATIHQLELLGATVYSEDIPLTSRRFSRLLLHSEVTQVDCSIQSMREHLPSGAGGEEGATGEVTAAIRLFATVSAINLNGLPVCDDDLQGIVGLQEADLGNTKVSVSGMIHVLRQSPCLRVLRMERCETNSAVLLALLASKDLEVLDVRRTTFSEGELANLCRKSSLRAIAMSGDSVTDDLLFQCLQKPEMESVTVDGGRLTVNGITRALKGANRKCAIRLSAPVKLVCVNGDLSVNVYDCTSNIPCTFKEYHEATKHIPILGDVGGGSFIFSGVRISYSRDGDSGRILANGRTMVAVGRNVKGVAHRE